MAYGTLRIQSYAARQSAPIPEAVVVVTGDGFTKTFTTGESGTSASLAVAAPACSLSQAQGAASPPYATLTVVVKKAGYRTVTLEGVQVFAGQATLALAELVTASGEAKAIPSVPVVIPPHALYAGDGGSGPAPAGTDADDGTASAVLDRVVIPNKITVHLGKPSASAQNVTVSFPDYIANVASSEVYPTWPEQALRANIHAQISLALNRIYTEWYPSKGYSYNITNSTSYDQYFVYGCTVFDVMTKLTADIFNTYVRKTGTVNPYYTEYCDGKSVSCPGMKQWGTVTQADSGKNALQILKYYYGSDIEIVRCANLQAIPESYPGSPLKAGSRGTAVSVLQRQLNRIAKDYPSFGKLTTDGIFGSAMTATVKKFQAQFGLTADGIVGRATWYKISYIYVSVKDLAELTSEGETDSGALSDGTWGGAVLKQGSSGSAVEQAQFWLSTLSTYYSGIPAVTVDGKFGTGTRNAVLAFQEKFGLDADGIIGQKTWEELYAQFQSIQSDNGSPNAYPGTALRSGSSGESVKLVQFWLKIAKTTYSSLADVTVDGRYGSGTKAAVEKFQCYFSLAADGVVGRTTWEKLYEVYNDIANDLLSAELRPGEYPGVLQAGSSGTAVRELQYYLYIVAAYESSLPSVSIDGQFGARTQAAVKAYQSLAGLTADGIVGQKTWNALYAQASKLRLSGPVVTIARMAWPGRALKQGDTGDAVLYWSTLLERIAYYFYSVQSIGRTSVFTSALVTSTRSFQALEGLPETGEADEDTWLAAEALSLTLLASAEPEDTVAASEYPAAAAAVGSAGAHVTLIQKWLNAIAAKRPHGTKLAVTGIYRKTEAAAVAAFQSEQGFSPNGVVCRNTWYALRAEAGGD